ncbi:MAG: T9SS type A sorting domain-containing protein, partial [Flavobacteriales bacterium]|nr:T9SS type A sorting domain-containing protein [Flavobacteriales bacterium]
GTAFEECSIGVKEEELAGISIYPNPSEGMITVNAASAADHTVQVMNLLGEVVATSRFNVNTILDLTDLAKGVYTVRVSTATAAMVQRVTLN